MVLSLAFGDAVVPATARAIVVPTASAAAQLARAIDGPAIPAIVTRGGLYDELQARLDHSPPRLTPYERDVIVQAAARETSAAIRASAAASALPFAGERPARPGLLAEILRFYDQLRRQARNVARFEELLEESLGRDAEHDRGAERMLAQTRFLAATFRGYEQRVLASGACDEHTLREGLMATACADPIRHLVVTVADWIADPDGLYLSDFDLLTRLPGLESIDIVATDALLGSGFHQRVHDWLPGIEEVSAEALGIPASEARRPQLEIPGTDPEQLVFVHRDREEELMAIARRVLSDRNSVDVGALLTRTGVVFKRPLPYLYLAREVFGGSGIAYQGLDALPLAAEPFAAALDVVLEFVESSFTRASIVALLRSPHFGLGPDAQPLDRHAIGVLDRALSEKRYLGGFERLTDLAAEWTTDATPARTALQAAVDAARELAPLATPDRASTQLRRLIDFVDAHERRVPDDAPSGARLRRARHAVRASLESLAIAHEVHDDPPMAIAEVTAAIRRWTEEHTFVPDPGTGGVQLLDDQAARYAELDDLTIVGLVEGEWPERPRRNIFYSSSLLASLGWPSEQDRRGAAEARFLELLASPSRTTRVSTISLDDETLVEPSNFADVIALARLSTVPAEAPDDQALLLSEMLMLDEVPLDRLERATREWAALRLSRSSRDDSAFHGQTGTPPPRPWSVSALETYLGCPFKYFAQRVIRLEEEPDDEEVMDPRAEGLFVHEVFEAFFDTWQRAGHEAITPETIDAARALFRDVVDTRVARLPASEAVLARARLLGSPAAVGLGEAVLRMEAERPVPVVGRLLEHPLRDEFVFQAEGRERRLALNGKADRIDLLADGTFRLIDYKLGSAPNRSRALQLPIYAICAEQALHGHLGRRWTLGEAAYLAFKGPRRVAGLFSSAEERAEVLAGAQERLVAAVDAIEAGRFPPTPDDVHRCETCAFDAVCRKDYVGDV